MVTHRVIEPARGTRGEPVELVVDCYTATCAAGVGLEALGTSIRNRQSGLSWQGLAGSDLGTWVGRVSALDETPLPPTLQHLESRCNRLAWLGLQQDGFLSRVKQIIARLGAHRVGALIGTSTSSIGRTEEAYTRLDASGLMAAPYCQPEVHHMHSPGTFVVEATGIAGPAMTISTACSSGAKVFAAAARWIRHGLVDAVLVGGVDSLCLSTLYGFRSLQLVSSEPCRPFDRRRNGISIGEAAGFAVVMRGDLAPGAEHAFLGSGESSDAYHMSHPHPEGKGAILAMKRALERSSLSGEDIDYVNLHGTASKANDLIETLALAQCVGNATLASSTKGWTGHTLGAAGMLEAIIVLESIRTGLVPGTLNCEQPEDLLHFPIESENIERPVSRAMTNSFGFGGNNATLVFGARGG